MPRHSSGSRSPSRSRSRSPRRSRSPSLSVPARRSRMSVSRSRSLSRTPRRSRSRTPRRSRSSTPPSRSRSRSKSPAKSPVSLGDQPKDLDTMEVDYDFVPLDEESPTFSLAEATVDLVRNRVYQAPPLNKKYFNDVKKDRYLMAREVHGTLEPKPIPAQVVSAMGGFDFSRLHGSLLHLHKIARLTQRPLWALMELLQKSRKLMKNRSAPQFVSPPFIGTGTVPEGFAKLDYSQEDEDKFGSTAPANPSGKDFADAHKSLGVHIKYHDTSQKAMTEMAEVIRQQQLLITDLTGSMDVMWGRIQDYLNMARYQETHIKDMRRTQLVKAHTREFADWLDLYLKDKDHLHQRDVNDEILANEYDVVVKQFKEDMKNKNVALKRRPNKQPQRPSYDRGASGGGDGGGGSAGTSGTQRNYKSKDNYKNYKDKNKSGGGANKSNKNSNNKSQGGSKDNKDQGRNNKKKSNSGKTA